MLPPVTALKDTVQSFAPKESVGPLFIDINRGPILLPRGTKQRENQLRQWDTADFNTMWQGARSGLVKKIGAIPYEINGPATVVQQFQDLLGYAHFGKGWEYLLAMCLRDFLTQSYGAIFEIAGPGDSTEPLVEAPTGINHLDAGRCYVTGNPTYPILYYSLWTGKLHKIHATRIYQMVDDPIPDERYFGLGTSALERAIAVSQREVRMNEYVDARLDDKPQPGILSLAGVSDANWQMAVVKYLTETGSDTLGPFGKTMVLTSLDPNAKVQAESIPFSQTPEKFDLQVYKSLDVDEIALAIGIDRQEIWELAGRGLGSGSQSMVLAEKAKGKTTGAIINGLERFINWAILPDSCEFRMVAKDEAERSSQATINLQYAQIGQALFASGFTKEEIGRVLVEGSETFADAFTDDQGKLTLDSAAPAPDTMLTNLTPAPAVTTPQDSKTAAQSDTPMPSGSKGLETPEQQRWFFANYPEYSSSAQVQGDSFSVHNVSPDHADRVSKELGQHVKENRVSTHIPAHNLETSQNRIYSAQRELRLAKSEDQKRSAQSRLDHAVTMAHYDATPYRAIKHADKVEAALDSKVKDSTSLQEKYTHVQSRSDVSNAKRNLIFAMREGNNDAIRSNTIKLGYALEGKSTKAFGVTASDFETRFEDILSRAIRGKLRPSQTENLMLGLLQSAGTKAYTDGLAEGGITGTLTNDDNMQIQNILLDSIDYLDPMLQSAFDGDITEADATNRAAMWVNKTLTEFLSSGRYAANRNGMYEFYGVDGKESCPTCQRLLGQVHRFSDWQDAGLIPQQDTEHYDCGGWQCQHQLRRTTLPETGVLE